MHIDTMISQDMDLTASFRAYDASVKRLLANKPFLARIMKDCMYEYKDCTIDDIIGYIEGEPQIGRIGVSVDETTPHITGLNTEDKTLTEGTIFYDIRYTALVPKDDDFIRIIINVEAQNNATPGYPLLKRAIYYCSRMISAQKGVEFKHSEYNKIKKVYSVWICSNPPKEEEDTITAYGIKELPIIGHVVKDPEEYDLLSVIMICLGNHNESIFDVPEKNVLGMLEVLLKGTWTTAQRKHVLETDYGIKMTKQIEGEVGQMCNLSKGVYESGIEKGIEKGMKKGIEKGMEKGIEKGIDKSRIESLRALIASMNISLEKAIELLNYPMEEKAKYAAALNGQ